MPKAQAQTSKTVHLVSQVKGGVGKSVVASWTAQYLKESGRNPQCFDADPGNRTFSRFEGLGVEPVELMRDGDVDPGMYDVLVERILTEPGPFVIDTGSSTFTSLWNYIDKNSLFEILNKRQVKVYIHVPVAAEPDLVDTLDGFRRISSLSPERSVILWLNQRSRRIEHGGINVLDLDIVKQQSPKIYSVVANSRQVYGLYEKAVSTMLRQNGTFDHADGLNSMDIERLQQVRDEVYGQLRETGI